MVHPVMHNCYRGCYTAIRNTGHFTSCGIPRGDLIPIVKRALIYPKIRIAPITDSASKEKNPWVYFSIGLGVGIIARKAYSEFKRNQGDTNRQEYIESKPASYISSGKFQSQIYIPIPPTVFREIVGTPCLENNYTPVSELAYVRVTHYDLKGRVQVSAIIIHNWFAERVMEIFQEMYAAKVGVEITPIDQYGSNELCLGVTIGIKGLNKKNRGGINVPAAFQARNFICIQDSKDPNYSRFTIDPSAIKTPN